MINFMAPGESIKLANQVWERPLGWTLDEIRARQLDILSECYPDPRVARLIHAELGSAFSSQKWDLEALDKGRGITGIQKSGPGILDMRKRARMSGAKLDIHGAEGVGTTIAVRLALGGPGQI